MGGGGVWVAKAGRASLACSVLGGCARVHSRPTEQVGRLVVKAGEVPAACCVPGRDVLRAATLGKMGVCWRE